MIDQIFQSLACCSDRANANNKATSNAPTTMLITCFDQTDKEITDLSVPSNTSWSEMQDMVTGGEALPCSTVCKH